jgi:hypothetical protein
LKEVEIHRRNLVPGPPLFDELLNPGSGPP